MISLLHAIVYGIVLLGAIEVLLSWRLSRQHREYKKILSDAALEAKSIDTSLREYRARIEALEEKTKTHGTKIEAFHPVFQLMKDWLEKQGAKR